jgi:hypothetical protein
MTEFAEIKNEFLYLAGPMTGYPQFNFPLFIRAAEKAREQGFDVISPAELDQENNEDYDLSINSPDGELGTTHQTFGDYLSRDVKIVHDHCVGVIFLPKWFESKGARMEAYVALTAGFTRFYHYQEYAGIDQDIPYTGAIKSYPIERVRGFVRESI